MTREEREKAIRKLTEIKNYYEKSFALNTDFSADDPEDELHALNTAIEVLKQEPCEDLISRKAVKDAVEGTIAKYIPTLTERQERIPLELARAINEVPSVPSQPLIFEDAVSRTAALESFKPRGISDEAWEESETYKKLIALPSLTLKRKRGEWIQQYQNDGGWHGSSYWAGVYKCSRCGQESATKRDFCPNCFADMRKEQSR